MGPPRRGWLACGLAVGCAVAAWCHTPGRADGGADPLAPLAGRWVGEGASEQGQGGGWFTFERDLQGRAWVRRNHAEYPQPNGRPAYVHDDLMVVYQDPAAHALRAFYCDTEQHVIRYTVTASAGGDTIVFLGDRAAGAPRFRLTYARTAPDRMTVALEQADAASPDAFRRIVEGKVRRQP